MFSSTPEQRKNILAAIGELTNYDTGRHTTWNKLEKYVLDAYPSEEYTHQVVVDALQFHDGRNHIEATHSFGGDWSLLSITFEGKEFLNYGEPEPMPTQQFNFNAPTNFQHGDHNVQHIQIGFTLDQVNQLVDALREDGHAELAEQIDQEVVKTNDPGRLMPFLGSIITAIAGGGAGGVAEALIPILTG